MWELRRSRNCIFFTAQYYRNVDNWPILDAAMTKTQWLTFHQPTVTLCMWKTGCSDGVVRLHPVARSAALRCESSSPWRRDRLISIIIIIIVSVNALERSTSSARQGRRDVRAADPLGCSTTHYNYKYNYHNNYYYYCWWWWWWWNAMAKLTFTCELEIHCGGKGDGQRTSTSGVVRLPIRGQRGPPATPEHHSIDHPPRFRYGTHRAPAGHQRPWSVNLDHQGRLERKATKVKAEQMDVQVCYFILITIIGS